jgi:hypothetical protein
MPTITASSSVVKDGVQIDIVPVGDAKAKFILTHQATKIKVEVIGSLRHQASWMLKGRDQLDEKVRAYEEETRPKSKVDRSLRNLFRDLDNKLQSAINRTRDTDYMFDDDLSGIMDNAYEIAYTIRALQRKKKSEEPT